MKNISIITFLFFNLISFGQEFKTIYYDSLGNKSKVDLGFKKVVYEKIEKKFKLTTFQKEIKTSEKVISDTINFAKDMKETDFYDNGIVAKKTTYLKNQIIGDVEAFYENGNKKCISYFEKHNNTIKEFIKSFWLIDGTQTVINGNGDYQFNISYKEKQPEISINGKVKNGLLDGKWNTNENIFPYFEEYYSNGELLNGIRKNTSNESIYYTETNKSSQPKDKLNIFRQQISRKIAEKVGNYTTKPLDLKMLIGFVIDANGKISNIEVLKNTSLDKEIDSIVIKILEEHNEWTPAENRGEKIESKYKLPLIFKLNQ